MIVDEKSIASATIQDGAMRMNGLEFRALVLPSVTLIAAAEVFERISAFQASGGRVWVTGDVTYRLPGSDEVEVLAGAPLLVSFQVGAGRVAYATFHVSAQTDAVADAIYEIVAGPLPRSTDATGGP